MQAVWIDAESDARADDVTLAGRVAVLTPAIAGSRPGSRGWPLPDLSALVAVARLWSEAHGQLAEDESSLRHTYGTRWAQVPRHHGALAAQAKEILGSGIVPVRLAAADPINVLDELGPFVQFTADTSKYLLEQASLLSEGLGSDLSGLTLGNLRRVSRAMLRLAVAPPPNPAWCRPAVANAASIASSALGDDMRSASLAYQHLYEEFTEDVWELPAVRRHAAIDRWWQVGARRSLRHALASVSRTGRPPSNLKATMATLRRAAALRDGVDLSWTSLRGHLGWFADTPIPDAEGAALSLAALQDLQAALGDRINEARLADLARADAFVCEELTSPADDIGDAVSAWSGLARRFNGPDPLAFTAPELAQWAIVTAQSLEVLRALKETTAALRPRIRSVAELFDDAVARDRIDQLRALLGFKTVGEGERS